MLGLCDPSHAYDTRAHIYEALGQKDDAIFEFRKALSLNAQLESSIEGLKRLAATP